MSVPPGTVIDGRYKVVRLLGEGGFGAVYLAQDTRLGSNQIALKESFDRSAAAQEQFRLEAQLLADLRHPGLPRVTDFFIEKDGRQFLVMDYVEGEDLDRQLLRLGRPYSEQDAVAIMLQVCEAVAYLHTRRPQPIIHRDIKPPNIKITPDRRAVLVDFGIAKIYHPVKGTAKIAKAVTPYFSPPEQHTASTDTRSDVYSLGATLYFMVTADVPPDAMERLNDSAPVIPPRKHNPTLSPALEQVIFQALELLPDRRYANANRLTAALRAYRQGQAVPASTAGAVCPSCGWKNRANSRFCARDGAPLGPAGRARGRQPAKKPPSPAAQAISPEMLFESANAFARSSDYTKAIPQYETSIQKGFKDLAVYHNLGVCYLELDRYAEAARILEKGVSSYPNDGDLHYHLARAYSGQKLIKKALDAVKQACQLKPDDAAHFRLYGSLLFDGKRYREAIGKLNQAARMDPDSMYTHLLLGRAYGESDDLNSAIRALKQATGLAPKSAEPHYWMAVYYHQARKKRQARAALHQAVRIDSGYLPAQELLNKL